MPQMLLKGPLVELIDSAGQQVQMLNAEIARLTDRRERLEAAIKEGIEQMIRERGHELPEHWEAQPSVDAQGLIVSWSEDG